MNALDAIAFIAERKIEEAMAEGVFDNLPGLGKPLHMEDLSLMPPDMRMAYTILKNSGCLEETAQQPCGVKELMNSMPDERRVYGRMQRLNVMMARVRRAEKTFGPEREDKKTDDSPYLEKLLKKV